MRVVAAEFQEGGYRRYTIKVIWSTATNFKKVAEFLC